jgi:hypothetical protein
MKRIRAVVLLIPLLAAVGCGDPTAPRIPSPREDRRTPTRDPSPGLDGAHTQLVVELTIRVV